MSHLKLFTDPRLPCPQRVHVVLRELALDVETVSLDVLKREHKTVDLARQYPSHALPLLIDSSRDPPLTLSESRAICRYLAAITPGGSLLPDLNDPCAVALFEEAASIEVTGFDPFANRLVFEKVFKNTFNLGPADQALIDQLEGQLRMKLDQLETLLGQRPYMAGSTFSLVDVFYVPYCTT